MDLLKRVGSDGRATSSATFAEGAAPRSTRTRAALRAFRAYAYAYAFAASTSFAMGCHDRDETRMCNALALEATLISADADAPTQLRSPRAVARMPSGSVLAAYVGRVQGGGPGSEVRMVDLTARGEPNAVCSATERPNANEDGDRAPRTFEDAPYVVAPGDRDGFGLVVFAGTDAQSSQIWARVIGPEGCADAPVADRFQVSEEPGPTCSFHWDERPAKAHCAGAPRAARLGRASDGSDEFAVVWVTLTDGLDVEQPEQHVRGRRLHVRRGDVAQDESRIFATAAEGSSDVGPVELPSGRAPRSLDLVATESGALVLLWQETRDGGAIVSYAQQLSGGLQALGDPVELAASPHGAPSGAGITGAASGDQIAVAFVEYDAQAQSHVVVRKLSVASGLIEAGDPPRLAQSDADSPQLAIASGPSDEFVVSWLARPRVDPASTPSDGDALVLQAQRLTTPGTARSAARDWSCATFAPPKALPSALSTTVLDDGALLMLYTAKQATTHGFAPTAVFSVVMNPSDSGEP